MFKKSAWPNRTLIEYDNFEPFALFCIVDDKSGISGSKESLPATTLGLPDHMVGFILVSEPEDEELDCEEVGVAKIDLRELIKAREDLVEKPVDVFRSGHKLNLHCCLFTIKLPHITIKHFWPAPGFFILTPLGRLGEDKSSETLSFFS